MGKRNGIVTKLIAEFEREQKAARDIDALVSRCLRGELTDADRPALVAALVVAERKASGEAVGR